MNEKQVERRRGVAPEGRLRVPLRGASPSRQTSAEYLVAEGREVVLQPPGREEVVLRPQANAAAPGLLSPIEDPSTPNFSESGGNSLLYISAATRTIRSHHVAFGGGGAEQGLAHLEHGP